MTIEKYSTEEISQLNDFQKIAISDYGLTIEESQGFGINQINAINCNATAKESLQFKGSKVYWQIESFCTGKVTIEESLQFDNKYKLQALEKIESITVEEALQFGKHQWNAFNTGKVTIEEALWFNDADQYEVLVAITGSLSEYYIDTINL